MNLLPLFAAVLLPVVANGAPPYDVTGHVVGVHDGDSITVLTGEKQQLKVRLEGIDAPELKQPFGRASKAALSDLVFDHDVRLHAVGTDPRGANAAFATHSGGGLSAILKIMGPNF